MNLKEYIEDNYNDLCNYARSLSSDPIDLVNHTYLRCAGKEADNPEAYFRTALWKEAKVGTFKNQYTYRSYEHQDIETPSAEIDEKLHAERIDFFLLNFDELDREIYKLWAEGWCMKTFSKESGIPYRSIGYSLNKIREYLKEKL